MLERGLRADEPAPLGGVRLRQQPGDRHLRERRVAVIRIAVGVCQLDRLVDVMDVLGGVHAERLEIDALEDVERLQQHRALIPRSSLVDVETMKVRRRRLFDLPMEGR